MENKDLQQTIQRYNQRLDALGPTDKALGWTRENNHIRLKALVADFWDEIPQSSLLDAGCGFGDLLGVLQKENHPPKSYLGYDINPRLIEEAKKGILKAIFRWPRSKTSPTTYCRILSAAPVFLTTNAATAMKSTPSKAL